MIIEDIDNLEIEIQETEDTSDFITMIIRNSQNSDELGRLRILKTRGRSFINALAVAFRENYGSLQEHEDARTRLVDKTSGTIQFEGD